MVCARVMFGLVPYKLCVQTSEGNLFNCYIKTFTGNVEDLNMPTLVQALQGYKITDVDCGGGEAHTLAVESNGMDVLCVHVCVVCVVCMCVLCV